MSVPPGYTGPTQVAADGKRYPAHMVEKINADLAAKATADDEAGTDRPEGSSSEPQAEAPKKAAPKRAPAKKQAPKKAAAKKAAPAKKAAKKSK